MKEIKKINFTLLWLFIILSPIIVFILVSIPIKLIDVPKNNDWIGFYSSIVGGLVGGLFAFYSVNLSMNGVIKQIEQ